MGPDNKQNKKKKEEKKGGREKVRSSWDDVVVALDIEGDFLEEDGVEERMGAAALEGEATSCLGDEDKKTDRSGGDLAIQKPLSSNISHGHLVAVGNVGDVLDIRGKVLCGFGGVGVEIKGREGLSRHSLVACETEDRRDRKRQVDKERGSSRMGSVAVGEDDGGDCIWWRKVGEFECELSDL